MAWLLRGLGSEREACLAEECGDEAGLALDAPEAVPHCCGELVEGGGGEVAQAA